MNTSSRFHVLVAVCIALFVACDARAIVLGTDPGPHSTQFDAIGAFSQTNWIIGTLEDPPFTKHNWYGSATLIAPDMVLMARHLLSDVAQDPSNPPGDGVYAVRFRRKPDGTVGDTQSGWWSYHNVRISSYVYPDDPAIDMVIGILEEPVTHIEPIPVQPWAKPSAGDALFIGAWGFDEFGSCSNPQGVRDRLRIAQTTAKEGFSWCYLVEFPSASNEGVAGPTCHDSGGAIMIVTEEGELRLVGVVFNSSSGYLVDTFQVFNPDYTMYCCYDPQGRCADADGNTIVEYDDVYYIRDNSGPCPPGVACPQDLNKDGVADIRDEVMVYGQVGQRCGVSMQCQGDLNYDGVVDGADLGLMTYEWGLQACGATSDITGDDIVDGEDLGLLLTTWGVCPVP